MFWKSKITRIVKTILAKSLHKALFNFWSDYFLVILVYAYSRVWRQGCNFFTKGQNKIEKFKKSTKYTKIGKFYTNFQKAFSNDTHEVSTIGLVKARWVLV